MTKQGAFTAFLSSKKFVFVACSLLRRTRGEDQKHVRMHVQLEPDFTAMPSLMKIVYACYTTFQSINET